MTLDPFAPIPADHPVLVALDALPPGEAVFDLDGTLLNEDIGEAVLRARLAAGPLPEKARSILGDDDPWGAYLALEPYPQAVAAAQALAGLSASEVDRLVDAAWASGEVTANPAVAALAAAVGRRHRVWILTGSAEVLGRACGARLGIPNVVGVRLRVADGLLTDEVDEPASCAEGKPLECRRWITDRPVFAIGDSPWDAHILRMAAVARTCGRSAGLGFPAFP